MKIPIALCLFLPLTFAHYQNVKPKRISAGLKLDETFNSINKTQVLIIGAGLAGLETARLLNQQNVKTINLEARDRIGGRIWSVKSKNGHVFDLGAAWIHGVNGSISSGLISNPLWELAKEASIETYGTLQTDYKAIYVNSSNNASNYDLKRWYSDFLEYVNENIKKSDLNKSLSDYESEFSKLNNFSSEQVDAFLSFLHFSIESYEGTELDLLGAKNFYEATSIHYGQEHVFQKTGYISVIEYLAKTNKNIRLGQIVNKIDYSSDVVKVYTKSGELYEASFVVVTVPLGILKGKSIVFDPELPTWKHESIERLGFGILDKVVLVWEKAWWNSTNYYFIRISNKPTEFSYWVNVNKWSNKPALFCYFVGKEAQRLENLNETVIASEALRALSGMFPEKNIPKPSEVFMTYWKSDPYSNGSYSYVSKNQKQTDPLYLSIPIENRLLFAGEATSTDSYGYAHGALQSARREATRLLYTYELLEQGPTYVPNSCP